MFQIQEIRKLDNLKIQFEALKFESLILIFLIFGILNLEIQTIFFKNQRDVSRSMKHWFINNFD
jgi:hypothetical protein